jgi:proteasome activator subunit 4
MSLLDSYKYSKYTWWTAAIMNLISTTAANTIGLIDWNQNDLIPKMFTRILRSLDLPVCYKQMKSSRDQSLYADSSAQFIVSLLGPKTDAFKYLDNLMATIETYLYPANKGKWTRTVSELLVQLVKYFHERIVSERYKIHPWKRPTPDDYKLRDEDITQFVTCVKPSAMQVMYSRGSNAGELLKLLADMKPDLIIPDIIERVFETVDSSTEPHKYTAVLQVLPYISHLMATGSHTVSKTQIIPLLFAVLPGIDLNDNRKTILTLQYVMLQSISITFVDCSKASLYHELTEEESLICEQTAQLEDFILQFLDRVFHLIENTGAETTRMEHSSHMETIRTKLESLNETLIRSTIQSILSQCSQDILNSATKKLVNYIESGTILESKIAAPTMASVCSAFAGLNGPSLYKSLLPYLINSIQQHFSQSDDIFESEKQNDELFYYMTLLNIIRDDPIAIQIYIDELISIFDLLFKCKCKMTGRATVKLVSNLLMGLSTIATRNVKTVPDAFKKSLEEYLPIRDWGRGMQRDETIKFFIPGIEEKKQCEKIIHYYLPPILEKFEKFYSNELDLTKDQLDIYLRFLHGILLSNNFLKNWEDEDVKIVETVVDTKALKLINGYEGVSITMPNGDNIRKTIYECLHKLQKKILTTKEDDFNSIIQLMNVYEKLHCFSHRNQSSDTQFKILQKTKVFQEFK